MNENGERDEEITSAFDEVERVNNLGSKGPIGALLTPAATVFGNRLGEWAENVTKKRQQNIKCHVEAISNSGKNIAVKAEPIKQQNLFEWAEAASSCDPDDEMSALWKGIFDNIANSHESQSTLISIAKKLTIQDIKTLQRLARGKILQHKGMNLPKLASLGLIFYDVPRIIAVAAGFVFVYFFYDQNIMRDIIEMPFNISLTGFIIVLGMMLFYLAFRFGIFTGLSKEAREIISLFNKYSNNQEK